MTVSLPTVLGVRWRTEQRLQCYEGGTRARTHRVSATTASLPVIKIVL
jgi:hypothetical protein